MASTTPAGPAADGHDLHQHLHEHVLRPRPRKPQHAQLADVSRSGSAHSAGSYLGLPTEGTATSVSSGRSTPVPHDALPSVKSLSSARRQARAERRLFPTVDFTSRVSHFDPKSDYRDFYGFFNLFWIGLAIMAISTMLRNIKDTGSPLRVQIWSLFTVKLWHLAIADFLMVASTAVSFPLHTFFRRAPAKSFWTWSRGGRALQSIYQLGWLYVWISVPFSFGWTWTSHVFLLLHTMVLLMKMHSYAFYGGHLSETEKRLKELDHPSTADSQTPVYLYPTPEHPMGKIAGRCEPKSHHPPRPRRGSKLAHSGDEAESSGHESVDEVAELRSALARELTSPVGNVTYPANLTWSNYVDYLLCPTLCYEMEYPRVPSINWTSLVSKIVATFGCIFLLTVTSEEFILPVLVDSSVRLSTSTSAAEKLMILLENISWLLFPFMLTLLLVFLVIFEYILGAFAEITRFADRHFYSDWWNSTDWMEFSREWNVPVHNFLRRHVYSASRAHLGKGMATVVTFFISAIGHEIVMACITKKLRGYGLVCQMLQLPVVMVQTMPAVRGRKTLNNVLFWCSMILGLSLMCSLYVLV